ncbi:MAG: hypothetical protein OXC07_06390 [Kistimonas sp.]|nr:hypothetical protein [Kistimonas sp.]
MSNQVLSGAPVHRAFSVSGSYGKRASSRCDASRPLRRGAKKAASVSWMGVCKGTLSLLTKPARLVVVLLCPVSYMAATARLCHSLEAKNVRLWQQIKTADPSSVSRLRAFLRQSQFVGTACLTTALRVTLAEVKNCFDFTEFADHMGFLASNPIPMNYYLAGDCSRFSCVYTPGASAMKPSVSAEDLIAIKGRCAILQCLYRL